MEKLVNTVEAILFAAGFPISKKEILDKLPEDVSRKNLNDAIDKIALKYSGDCGILLQQFEDKLQFCSNDQYKEIVSAALQPVKEKELTKSLMETLAIIAYFQPITRAEIEEYKGGGTADYALAMLSRAELIYVSGYKQSPGRPILYATTDAFLKKFDLRDLSDLPSQEEVKKRMTEIGNFNVLQEGLYRADGMETEEEDEIETDSSIQQQQEFDEYMENDDDIPEFLKDGDISTYSGSEAEGGELEEAASDEDEDNSGSQSDNDEIPI